MKRGGRMSRMKNHDGKPREGTVLRDLYDRLRQGAVVPLNSGSSSYTAQLRDMYGMDLVSVGKSGSRLVGEWDGPYYVPIERIVQDT